MTNNVDLESKGIAVEASEGINFGDQSMGLADFMGVDVSEIEANEGGFEMLPQGVYVFHTDSIKVNSITRRAKDTNEEYKVPNISMKFIVDEVVALGNYDGDESKLIGRQHTEFVALPTFDGEQFSKAVGKLKAMAQKMAGREKDYTYPNVPAILEDIAEKSFSARIKHGKYTNRNGEEVATEDLDLRSIKANA